MPNRRGFQKKIQEVHWTGFTGSILGVAAGAASINLGAAQHLPETLMRTRGELLVWPDATLTPGQLAHVAVGLCQVPEGTGATTLWSPITDSDAPFFWYWSGHIGYEEAVTDVIANQAIMGARIVIDSKAMRKNRNMEIQLAFESVTVGSAVALNMAVSGRFLAGS